MGIGRNDMEKEQSALFATAVSLGAALLGGGAKLALDNMKATSVALIDSKISDNEAKKKELSKGLGWLTNSEEIEKINQEYARLRFGIGNEFPRGRQIDFVLGHFQPEDLEKIEERMRQIGHIHDLRPLTGGMPVETMHHIACGGVVAIAKASGQKKDHKEGFLAFAHRSANGKSRFCHAEHAPDSAAGRVLPFGLNPPGLHLVSRHNFHPT